MASMSKNNSSRSLMGFSVHQPALGAALQFFPAMGSEQLDEMIDAYVPGSASILDKRTAVSLEFFEHTMQTGELFKFFLVYPAVSPNTASPASTMQDSGYSSSFNTSPVMAESQWTQMSSASFSSSSSSSSKTKASSKQAASSSRAQTQDFSHIPGMKIMTKDGLDVTNSASRGCKTKEQRDHAHLMRIIKACDSCKRKKTRCDPSHKKRSSPATSSSPEPKAAKKMKKAATPSIRKAPPPANTADISFDSTSFDPTIPESFSFDANFMATTELSMDDWEQYIKYDEGVNDVIPEDYDFFFDPAGYFSPATDKSTSASLSPSQILTPGGLSQPLTPASGLEIGGGVEFVGADLTGLGESQQPTLPYLTPGGAEVGSNYVDFALYSPGSSCLDDDPALSKEVAASSGPDYYEYQQLSSSHRPDVRSIVRDGVTSSLQDNAPLLAHSLLSDQADHNQFATESTGSRFVQQGLLQPSDHGVLDQGNDRDQHHQQSSDVSAVAGGSYTRVPLDTLKPRVPNMTVSPIDTLLGLSRPALQALPISSGSTASAGVLAQSVKRRSSRQSLAVATDTFNELVTAPGLSPTTERASVVPVAATTTAASAPVLLRESPGVGRRRTAVVDPKTSDLRHQQLPEVFALGTSQDGVVRTGAAGNVQLVLSTTDAFANGLAKTMVRNSDVQSAVALRTRTSCYSTGLPQSQAHATPMLSLPVVAQATSLPLGEHPDGVLASLFPLGGLFAISAALGVGIKSTSLAGANKSGAAVLGLLPLLAMLSSFVAVAIVLCHALSSVSSLECGDISLPTIGATLIAVSSAALSPSSQQYSVSCMNKLDPFTQALDLLKRLSSKAIDNVKSQIHGVQSGFLNIQRKAESSRAINRYNLGSNAVSRVALVY